MRACREFVGDIEQIPPMYSALKRDGVALYELARKGITVERAARPVTIESLTVISIALPLVVFDVTCSKGTYIRTLAEDIGARLGCGAHLVGLQRTRVGSFLLSDSVSLPALEAMPIEARQALLAQPASLLRDLPTLAIDADNARRYRLGQAFVVANTPLVPGEIAVYDHEQRLLGVGHLGDDNVLQPLRSVAQVQ
jgi:tRNA pseudouridine55 synthase